jgi:hypothetical protein
VVTCDFPGFLPREISQPVGRDIPGYLPRENPHLNDRIAHSMLRTHDPLGAPSETLQNGVIYLILTVVLSF